MQLHLGCSEFFLDGLILEAILSNFKAHELAILSAVCRSLRSPAQLAAHRTLLETVRQLQSSLLRHCERGSWIHQLGEWEAVKAANVLWLQASQENIGLLKQLNQDDVQLVKWAADLSGHGHRAQMAQRAPVLRLGAINGHPAFEFDGASVLKTRPFAQPLPQPITLMVVARARGDTTIVDSLGPQCAHLVRRATRPPSDGDVEAPDVHALSSFVCVLHALQAAACTLPAATHDGKSAI